MTGIESLDALAQGVQYGIELRDLLNFYAVHEWDQGEINHDLDDVLARIRDQIKAELNDAKSAQQTSASAYDLLPEEDREAIEWVREHGGIAEVEKRLMPEGMEWPRFDDGEPVRIGDEISWKDDGGKVNSIELQDGGYFILNAADGEEDWIHPQCFPGERVKHPERKGSRLDGCCPCGSYKCDEFAFYDQDRGKDVFADKCLVPELRKLRESGIRTIASCCGHGTMRPNIVVAPECEDEMRRQGYEGRCNKFGVLEFTAKSECPAPKVLDAGGVEIRVGDTVYRVSKSTFDPEYDALTVTDIRTKPGLTPIEVKNSHNGYLYGKPEDFTHRAPVLAADGKPLRVGDTVWSKAGEFEGERKVKSMHVDNDDAPYAMFSDGDEPLSCLCCLLTHQRPDSWERLGEDCAKSDVDYCAERGLLDSSCDVVEGDGSTRHCTDCGCTCGEKMARDIVRRAKALAERDR